jgi:hypothetical protein
MRAKAQEQKQLLDLYESQSSIRATGPDLKSHTEAMIRIYEDRTEENIKEAAAHSRMARELAQQAAKPDGGCFRPETRETLI